MKRYNHRKYQKNKILNKLLNFVKNYCKNFHLMNIKKYNVNHIQIYYEIIKNQKKLIFYNYNKNLRIIKFNSKIRTF